MAKITVMTLLIVMAQNSLTVATADDSSCDDFPFFSSPHSQWHQLPEDCDVSMSGKDETEYVLLALFPSTLQKYLPKTACLDGASPVARKFKIEVDYRWGGDWFSQRTIECQYGSIG